MLEQSANNSRFKHRKVLESVVGRDNLAADFLTWFSPYEYARQGVDFEFPAPETCPNPECLMPIAPKKHGFYCRRSLEMAE